MKLTPEMLDAAMQEDARNVVLSDPVERMRRNITAALAVMWRPIKATGAAPESDRESQTHE